MNSLQARQAQTKLLISASRDGYGYTYAVSALGVVVAQGWVRTESATFVHRIATEIGKIAVAQWIDESDSDSVTQPMIRL